MLVCLYNLVVNPSGEAYMKLNKFEDAEHWYRESLKAKPDHVPAHLTYGKLLSIMVSYPGKLSVLFMKMC